MEGKVLLIYIGDTDDASCFRDFCKDLPGMIGNAGVSVEELVEGGDSLIITSEGCLDVYRLNSDKTQVEEFYSST